ncbi:MAG: glycosyltransferase family 39 protein [Anaerolineae bacterium]|nr:glycosyltransferase family 39 protein [Anaerolineae bacterium]
MKSSQRQRYLLGIILLVAFALRLTRLGAQNIWWDEGLSVVASRMSFTEATLWTAADVHPPLYFWLLWLWMRVSGETEFALRFITVLEAFLTVPAIYVLARRLSRSAAIGVGAAGLLALSRFHIWWSQEMRMYILAGLCATLSLYFTARLADGEATRRTIGGWILATAGAMLTVYSSIVLVPIENLTLLLAGWRGIRRREERWRFWARWIAIQAGVLPFVIPWMALALPRMRSWSVVTEPASLSFVLELNAVLVTLGISTDVGRYRLPALLVMGVLGVGIVLLLRHSTSPTERIRRLWALALLGSSVLLMPLIIWALSQPRALFYNPRVEARYLLPLAPAFYVLLAWALGGWLRNPTKMRYPGWVFCFGIAGLILWSLPQHFASRYLRDNDLTLSRIIWSHAQPEDALALVSGDRYPIFTLSYDRAPAPETRPAITRLPQSPPPLTEATADTELSALAAEHSRIWLVQLERSLEDPEGQTEAWLMAHFTRILHYEFGYNALSLFSATDEEPLVALWNVPPQTPLAQNLDERGKLLGYDLPTTEFRPLDNVRLGLYLQAQHPLTLTVTLRGDDEAFAGSETIEMAPTPAGKARYHQVQFTIQPYAPAQSYTFELSTPDGVKIHFGQLRVTHTLKPPVLARIPHQLEAIAGEATLLGYALHGAPTGNPPVAHPGDTLELTLYWQAQIPISQSYTVFTHLLGTAYNPATQGPLWAQDDQIPLEGAYPTQNWLAGVPLQDTYTLAIPPETPPGDYQILTGMYDATTGNRVPVAGAGADTLAGNILLTWVRIEP